jgi:type 1 fimbriae regulatory protein FimB
MASATICWCLYRHGLRVSEAIGLRRDDVDLGKSRLWVERLKGSLAVEHPIAGDELRAIKRFLTTRDDKLPWLFVSERGTQLTRPTVNYLIGAMTRDAGLPNARWLPAMAVGAHHVPRNPSNATK